MRLISVDPGVYKMAVASWKDGVLKHAKNVPLKIPRTSPAVVLSNWGRVGRSWYSTLGLAGPDLVVGEFPVVYPRGRGKTDSVDPNDIVLLAACAAAFYAGFDDLYLYYPSQWKAQVPKDICRQRIEAELTRTELAGIEKGGPTHDIYDAIGIGLFHLGRLGRGMVRP